MVTYFGGSQPAGVLVRAGQTLAVHETPVTRTLADLRATLHTHGVDGDVHERALRNHVLRHLPQAATCTLRQAEL